MVSGDISRGPDFISSFICPSPQVTEGGRTITGPLTFRDNPELLSMGKNSSQPFSKETSCYQNASLRIAAGLTSRHTHLAHQCEG